MTTVDDLLREQKLARLLDDWRIATEGLTEGEKAKFLASSLDLAAGAREFAIQAKRASAMTAFQMRLMQMAGEV